MDDLRRLTANGWRNVLAVLMKQDQWEEALVLARTLDETAFETCPHLLLLVGLVLALQLVPQPLRQRAMNEDFWLGPERVLLHSRAGEERQRALTLLARAESVLKDLVASSSASQARRWRVWLLLLESKTREEGESLLRDSLTVFPGAEMFVPLAHALTVSFELAPLQRQLAAREASGLLDREALLLRLQLLEMQGDPALIAQFMRDHETALIGTVFTPEGFSGLVVESLIWAGALDEARQRLDDSAGHLNEPLRSVLSDLLRQQAGEDIGTSLRERFEASRSDADLRILVRHLWDKKQLKELHEPALEAVRRQPIPLYLRMAIESSVAVGKLSQVLELCEAHAEVIVHELPLRYRYAEALFFEGRFGESSFIVRELVSLRNLECDAMLEAQLAVMTGNWVRLPALLERELSLKPGRSPLHLLRLAHFGASTDPSRALELLKCAISNETSDLQLLASAGQLAFELGDDALGGQWIRRAARPPGMNSPVQILPVSELLSTLRKGRERLEKSSTFLSKADIPIHIAAHVNNLPLSQLMLRTLQRNEDTVDVLQRSPLPVRHGHRSLMQDISFVRSVAVDLSALMIAAHFEVLPKVLERFDKLLIPWETFQILMTEERRARHHQPSLMR